MASKIYIQHTADGKSHKARRRVKQGRKVLPAELRRPCRVFGSVSKETRMRLDSEISYGMFKESNIIEMSLNMFFDKLDNMQLSVE